MITTFVRSLKRFLVLVPGIIIAYFSVRNIYPYLDRHLAVPVAVLFTYALAAYVLIPALIRAIRIFHPGKHLPHYCVTPDGFASDPVNIAIVGTRRQIIRSMETAGWYLADPHSIVNVTRQILSVLLNRPYDNMPMSSLFLFGRKQDLGFELPINDEIGHRHHVRFWATTHDPSKPLDAEIIRWKAKSKRKLNGDATVWIGCASKDVGLALVRHNAQITHMIHPDTNAERELIIRNLKATGHVSKTIHIPITPAPYRLLNRAWSGLQGRLESDGKLGVCYLKG